MKLVLITIFSFSIVSFSQVTIQGIVEDIDGNVYMTVKIGTQWWMIDNLKVKHYRNGDALPNYKGYSDGKFRESLDTGAYCIYDNKPANANTYGLLYNWYAVNDPRGLAPQGWHIPSDEEWQVLVNYLGGDDVAGGKMKYRGPKYWINPNVNIGATNESGFSALPGGGYGYSRYSMLGIDASFWSSTEVEKTKFDFESYSAWCRSLIIMTAGVEREERTKSQFYSVRCVKD